MKPCKDSHVLATMFAALTIIGCSISSMMCCRKRRGYQNRLLEEAMRTWEDEGGAVVPDREGDEEEFVRAAAR